MPAERDRPTGFRGRAREPMQDNASPLLRQGAFNMVQDLANRPDAMDGQYLATLFSTGAQDAPEHPLLGRKTAVKTRASVEADLANITCVSQVTLENRQLILAFGDKLRVKP